MMSPKMIKRTENQLKYDPMIVAISYLYTKIFLLFLRVSLFPLIVTG